MELKKNRVTPDSVLIFVLIILLLLPVSSAAADGCCDEKLGVFLNIAPSVPEARAFIKRKGLSNDPNIKIYKKKGMSAYHVVYEADDPEKLVELTNTNDIFKDQTINSLEGYDFVSGSFALPKKTINDPPKRTMAKRTRSTQPIRGQATPNSSEYLASISFPAYQAKLKTDMNVVKGSVSHAYPDVTTKVHLSNRDMNRIVCQGGRPIKYVGYSKEKGLAVEIIGENAFVKFLIQKDPVKGEAYTETPSEIYIICNPSDVYTLIAFPKNIPAQRVDLATGKKEIISKNLKLFEGLALERKIIKLTKFVSTDKIPDSFTVEKIKKPINVFSELDVLLNRIIHVEGEGLQCKEYLVALKSDIEADQMYLSEKYFLIPELAEKPVGVSLESLTLQKESPTRLFIIETQTGEVFAQ